MRSSKLDEHQRLLLRLMEKTRNLRRQSVSPEFVYAGPEDLVLQHGKWYRPISFPEGFQQGAPKSCFGNAIVNCAAHPELRYVEGYTVAPHGLPIPIHHAWNTDQTGRLLDTTWLNTGAAYLGVEFSLGRADTCSWNDDATVLDNPANKFAILREKWNGEDYAKRWPETPALEIARLGLAAKKAGIKFTINEDLLKEL